MMMMIIAIIIFVIIILVESRPTSYICCTNSPPIAWANLTVFYPFRGHTWKTINACLVVIAAKVKWLRKSAQQPVILSVKRLVCHNPQSCVYVNGILKSQRQLKQHGTAQNLVLLLKEVIGITIYYFMKRLSLKWKFQTSILLKLVPGNHIWFFLCVFLCFIFNFFFWNFRQTMRHSSLR